MTRIDSSGIQNKKSLEEKLSSLLLYWSVIMPILTGIPFVPSALKYVADIIWGGLIFCTVVRGRIAVRKDILPLVITVILLAVYVTVVYLCRYQTLLYFVWGVRNLFRYYIAFFAYTNAINEENTEKWFSFLEKIFWINTAVSVVQFVFMGVKQDNLGGVFGTAGGTNGYTIALLCIVVIRSLLMNFEKRGNMSRCFWVCVAALAVAAMAELKFFFVLFVIILVYAACVTKFSFRKLLTMMCGILGVFIGVKVLVAWFGFDDFFSFKGIVELATRTSYATSTSKDVNRLSAISTLNRLVMDSPFDRIFGLGLGNCDTSAFSIFNSAFYRQHRSLHYTWFTAPMIYLETGYIGLAIYLSFFCVCFSLAVKKYLRGDGNKLYCQMTMILCVICGILVFYNASLRYEAAYMLYFVLALPFMQPSSRTKTPRMKLVCRKEHGKAQ